MTKLMKEVLLGGVAALLVAGLLNLVSNLPKERQATEVPDAHQSRPAVQGKYRYNPGSCSKDAQGMVYFALGRMVIRQPAENLVYITGNIEGDPTLPQPPDPAEPKGCPDHPIQIAVGGYSLARLSAMPWEERNPASEYADHVSMVLNDGRKGIATEDDMFELQKSDATAPGYPVPGFDVSGNNPKNTNYLTYRSRSYFIPDGRALTISCGYRVEPNRRIRICKYAYGVDEKYAMYAAFNTDFVPLTEITAADREIRRRFEAAQIPDYPWKESLPTVNGGDR